MAPISDPYGSRSSKDAAIIARQEPVVYTDYESFDNDEVRNRIKAFESDGYLLIEDLFSDEEVEVLRAEVKERVQNTRPYRIYLPIGYGFHLSFALDTKYRFEVILVPNMGLRTGVDGRLVNRIPHAVLF